MDRCSFFFLVIAVLYELCWLPYFINSMAPVKRWNSPKSLLISLPVIRLVSMLLINDGFIRTPGVLSIVSCHLTAIGGLVERENDRPGSGD